LRKTGNRPLPSSNQEQMHLSRLSIAICATLKTGRHQVAGTLNSFRQVHAISAAAPEGRP
jgi:hypothetical protein